MLAQRLRRWPNIKTALLQRVVFAGSQLPLNLSLCTLFYLSQTILAELNVYHKLKNIHILQYFRSMSS